MIQISNKADCCGCTACETICGKKAITMKPDALGFLYPIVDQDRCTNCGLCEKVCSFHKDYDVTLNLRIPKVYAARHKKMEEINTSRSGAVFIALSDWVLENNGVVYGAAYEGHFKVIHKRATTKEGRNEFKGSKYVQSNLNVVFKEIRTDLRNGKSVLFSGTPCQTSGLRSYLINIKIDVTNLYLCDIVCHGVPSPNIWGDYIQYSEKKFNKKFISANFRDKSEIGWAAHKESFTYEKGKIYSSTYTHLFYQHIMLRHSCGKCYFTNFKRPADVTIADYWGWEKLDANFNKDNKGISLLLVNTKKGQDLFEKINGDLNYIESKPELCLQPNLQHPSEIHLKRELFEKEYSQKGFEYVAKKYGNLGWRYKVQESIKIGKRIIKKIVS